ncbi:MAG: hypothetical protein HYV08_05875 [Deltaproteobacteria bacterium]|nr:hypothetical protein [Deltaproteobacteria bacterium]
MDRKREEAISSYIGFWAIPAMIRTGAPLSWARMAASGVGGAISTLPAESAWVAFAGELIKMGSNTIPSSRKYPCSSATHWGHQ